jgi:hypothetical protein
MDVQTAEQTGFGSHVVLLRKWKSMYDGDSVKDFLHNLFLLSNGWADLFLITAILHFLTALLTVMSCSHPTYPNHSIKKKIGFETLVIWQPWLASSWQANEHEMIQTDNNWDSDYKRKSCCCDWMDGWAARQAAKRAASQQQTDSV